MPGQEHSLPPMPLVDLLLQFARSERVSWHMPGHASGHSWPAWLKSALVDMDVTELPLTGDLNQPAGLVLQAMELAATAFGAGMTRLITSGSTTAMQILLAACVGRGAQLLLPRSSHQSVLHAIALLDLVPCWLQAEDPSEQNGLYSLLPQVTAESVDAGLVQNPGCRAVLITSPDYYGGCANLAAIAAAAHRHGALLLVDEAHGAHLNFAPDLLPQAAMAAGADACVQSGHKTLPVLTPGAYLHLGRRALSEGQADAANLDRLIPVFQTSSPSFPVAATLDYARAWLAAEGRFWIGRQLDYLDEFIGTLPDDVISSPRSIRFPPDCTRIRDPLRLVLTGTPGRNLPAGMLAGQLSRLGLDIEFADLTRMVLIPALQQPASAWRRLAAELQGLLANFPADGRTSADRRIALEQEWRLYLTAIPESVMKPGEALLNQQHLQTVPLAQAAGRISARAILPYPPGIPLVWPGERLDQPRVDFLRQLMENEIRISGIEQANLRVIA